MTDPIHLLPQRDLPLTEAPWTWRFLLYLRAMAVVSLAKGLYHWSAVIGLGDGPGSTFEGGSVAWQAASIYFAVIDPIAAVGLWLVAAWGGVVWLTAAISMAAIEVFFPQVFGGRIWVALAALAMVAGYFALAIAATRERPD
jgi:hypothetical protein